MRKKLPITIRECKEKHILPGKNTKVQTEAIYNEKSCEGFFVGKKFIKARKTAAGIYVDFVPGTGGDVWWVRHDDDSVGAYMANEVFDLER